MSDPFHLSNLVRYSCSKETYFSAMSFTRNAPETLECANEWVPYTRSLLPKVAFFPVVA